MMYTQQEKKDIQQKEKLAKLLSANYYYPSVAELIIKLGGSKPNQITSTNVFDTVQKASKESLYKAILTLSPSSYHLILNTIMKHEIFDASLPDLLNDRKQYLNKLLTSAGKEELIKIGYSDFLNSFRISNEERLKKAKKSLNEGICFKQFISDKLFSDTARNVIRNYKSLRQFKENFENRADAKLLSDINKLISIMQPIAKISKRTTDEEFKNFVHATNKLNFDPEVLLYKVIKKCKLIVAKVYKEQCSDLSKFPSKIKDGIKIIDGTKNKFKMFVSCTRRPRYKDEESQFAVQDPKKRHSDLISCTFISDKVKAFYLSPHKGIIYGYTDFDPLILEQVSRTDNYSHFIIGNSPNPVTKYAFDFLPPDALLEETEKQKEYNECDFICIGDWHRPEFEPSEETVQKIPKFTPSCVYCHSYITEEDKVAAKELNIPIFFDEGPYYCNDDDHLYSKNGSEKYDFALNNF